MKHESGLTLNQLAERNANLVTELEKCRELSGCQAGVDLQDWVKQLAAESVAMKQQEPKAWYIRMTDEVTTDSDEAKMWRGVPLVMAGIETPATDRIVAGIKADTANQMCVAFVKHKELAGLSDDDVVTVREATDAVLHCAEVISEGAEK